MLEQIRSVVGEFLKVSPNDVSEDTRIDRQALKSSIVVHRLYARLAENGVQVSAYHNINTVGDLINRLNGHEVSVKSSAAMPRIITDNSDLSDTLLGVDLESRENFPEVADFRESEFYTMNFSSSEISHCNLQPDPYLSFAGLFAAKEAIIKADQSFRSLPFNQIEIGHQPDGKPVYQNFTISISHAGQMAMAAAVQIRNTAPVMPSVIPQISGARSQSSAVGLILALIALVVAIVSFFSKS
jgi:phosphopantetheine--protein transferase-like protein